MPVSGGKKALKVLTVWLDWGTKDSGSRMKEALEINVKPHFLSYCCESYVRSSIFTV